MTSNSDRRTYPWDELEPGDKFTLQLEHGEKAYVVAASVRNAGKQWCLRNRPEWTVTARVAPGGTSVVVELEEAGDAS